VGYTGIGKLDPVPIYQNSSLICLGIFTMYQKIGDKLPEYLVPKAYSYFALEVERIRQMPLEKVHKLDKGFNDI
jgi:hypothetical protein